LTELGLHRSKNLGDVVAYFSRGAFSEGGGAVSVHDLVSHPARRCNPQRVIVGEILGSEVGAVLDVFSGSTRGSACTIHARSAVGTPQRFVQYGLAATPMMPVSATRAALAESAPLIVHLTGEYSSSGSLHRRVTSVAEVVGMEGDQLQVTELWASSRGARARPVNVLSTAGRHRMETVGWSWASHGWGNELGQP
jgi:pilus assembly protein CpaF